ncbi:MAG: recombination mediator RecR [Polyangia bacterium]
MSSRDPIQRLVRELSRLPGIGEKTATRLAFHVLRSGDELAKDLAQALVDVKERVRLCSRCMNLTEEDPCALCADTRRDDTILCVVASAPDLMAIERTGGYRGRYHVLHGVLSPLEGIGPDDLRIRELLVRLGSSSLFEEIILATSPNIEGEATALYLGKVLRPIGIKTTRIASGLQVGGELEYADGMTIARALDARREV